MTLIKSISGIRGTIGGSKGSNFTPIDIVECTAGFGTWILNNKKAKKVIVGRDGRISGELVSNLAINTLLALGIDVVDLGLSTTPTVEMMVPQLNAGAGIIFTASHNPKQWNALKFLNDKGEFISAQEGEDILNLIKEDKITYTDVDSLGTLSTYKSSIADHIDKVIALPYVDIPSIKSANLHVVVDCINSTGAISIPPLLDKLGVKYKLINEEITGEFAHNPEPLPSHLAQLSDAVTGQKADLGISIDPDVDRLAFVNEDGSMFGEEYTLVAVADHILSIRPGNTVSNLSSTRALADVTRKHGGRYSASAVGEVNVVKMMKSTNAVIGGEGNGGIILPDLHYGRDALVGIAIFLSLYASKKLKMTELKASYPTYFIEKDKVNLEGLNVDEVIAKIKKVYQDEHLNEIDGLKIDFSYGWVHIRKSNTEPIIRIYAESSSEEKAKSLIQSIKNIVN